MKKTGFRSPADDFVENDTDWNQILIRHSETTTEITAGSDSMIERGILNGSKVIVDRMILPSKHGQIVYVRINDTFYIRELFFDQDKRLYLVAANPNWGAIEVTTDLDHQIIGKVTFSINKH